METPWSERRPPSRGWLIAAVAFGLLTVLCILFADQPVARAVAEYEASSFWAYGTLALEWAVLWPIDGLVLPVLLVVVLLATVIVKRWRRTAPVWMVIAGVHLIARLSTAWVKDLTGRLRPGEWMKQGGDGTFWEGGAAFPSGHVAAFASLVIALLLVTPRNASWRPLIWALAIVVTTFIAVARVAIGAHWVSDTVGAISLTLAWTWLVGWAARPDR